MDQDPPRNRRPLASRTTAFADAVTRALLRTPITPDAISLAGIVFACLAAAAMAQGGVAGFLLGAVFVQLRLAANLFDGLVAVEGGRASPLGPLFNEAPDRIEDTVILAGFGVAVGAPALGLWAAIAALFCAYVRMLGGALGQEQDFVGPMAKQHRMAVVTAACLIGAVETALGRPPTLAAIALWAILAGALLTSARRLARIARRLRGAR